MLTLQHIKDVLKKEGKPLSFKDLAYLVGYNYPELGQVFVRDIKRWAHEQNGFKFREGKVSFDRDVPSPQKLKLEYEENAKIIIDAFLDKLYTSFGKTKVREPLQHFATLVLFDRALNFHFQENLKLNELSVKKNPTITYASVNQVQDYLTRITELNNYEFFHQAFTGVVTLIQDDNNKDDHKIELKRAYYSAFNVCLEFQAHQFESILFGKRFNRFISNKVEQQSKGGGEFRSPEIIGKIVANFSNLEPGFVVYDPAVGFGSFLVEIAHHYSKFDFRLKGFDINWGTVQICKINLLLNGITNFSIENTDSILESTIEDGSVDLAISNPPFGLSASHLFRQGLFATTPGSIPYDPSFIFTAHMLLKIKPAGRIIQVVSDSTLFATSTREFRKFLYDSEFIERVISLPIGIFAPYTNVATSLLILNKDQSRKKSVAFVDGRKGLNITVRNRELNISDEAAEAFINDISLPFNPSQEKEFRPFIPVSIVAPQLIAENDFDLTPRRYTDPTLSQISTAKRDGETFVKLREILESVRPAKSIMERVYPHLRIKDLVKSGGRLIPETIEDSISGSGNTREGGIINSNCVLVARVGLELKPTYFNNPNGDEVYINTNIFAFSINLRNLDIDYLIGQLASDLVRHQADLYRSGSGAQSISMENFLSIEIPLLSLSEQIEWVAKNSRKEVEKDELSSFIKSIPLIETSADLKNEIERFTVSQFKNTTAEYNSVFDQDKFPFTKQEVELHFTFKKSKDHKKTYILLDDDNYGIFGIITVHDENPIDFKKCQTINSYANFLFKIYNYLTKTSTNRQLERFAHTTKNFFAGIQGRVDRIINSPNEEFVKSLKHLTAESEKALKFYQEQGRSKEEFTLFNQLTEIQNSVSGIAGFYLDTDKLFKKIQEAKKQIFDIVKLINDVKRIHPEVTLKFDKTELPVLSKAPLVEQAFLDLTQNAIKYSKDRNCLFEIVPHEGFILITISNKVVDILPEEKYLALGNDWVKDEAKQYVHYGIYQSFQAIKEADGDIELSNYKEYSKSKTFKVLIKLQKALW